MYNFVAPVSFEPVPSVNGSPRSPEREQGWNLNPGLSPKQHYLRMTEVAYATKC